MESKAFKSNIIITMSILMVVICTLLFTLKTEELVEQKQEKENKLESVLAGYNTPGDLTYDDERNDMCKWAEAQEGIKESGDNSTPFHDRWGNHGLAWCQLFINWCSYQVTSMQDWQITRKVNGSDCFLCADCHAAYASLNGSDRKAGTSATPEKGWVRYEGSSKKPSHAALNIRPGIYAHGNWSDKVQVTDTTYMGKLKGYGKPFYRSKVYYNTNQSGASYNGYTHPSMYSTWYTEEVSYSLATSGPTCSGKSFQGWYKESSCSTKITTLGTSTRGAITVYAKWSGGTGGGSSPTPTVPETIPPVVVTDEPTEEPDVYWSIIHYPNGGYFTGSYPTYYKEGVGCSIPQNNVARTGYTFNGWYDYSYGYRTRIYASDTGDKYLYAQWTPNKYPLYLYTQTGKVKTGGYSFTDLGNKYYRYNKMYTYDQVEYLPTQPNGIDRRGHDFGGWYKDSGFSNGPYTNLPKGTIGTQTFYAKWTPQIYDLILHKHGGTVVNTRIDNGKVIGDDIIGTYTYGKGSTFPKANDDIYKKDSIFQGWYDNSSMSGTPHTGIRSGDDDTAPIGDKEYWGRWLEILPNVPKNDATEVIDDKLILYIYYTYKISAEEGKGVERESTPTAVNKRFFCVDLKPYPSTSASSAVKVWLSTDPNPDSDSSKGLLKNFTVKSTKSISGSGGVYKTQDNSTLTFTCPSDIENFVESDGHAGSRKVYVHVETVTGNRGVYEVNIVKRALYAQH